MKEKRRIFILTVMACFCTLVMQAQEVKSVSLDSIPKASLPKEGMSLEYSRPSLCGFPVLQGKSYYSESNAPWMSEEGKPLEIAPNAILEPYEYYDRDAIFTCSAETLFKINEGKLDPVLAVTLGKLKVEGNIDKALYLKKLIDSRKAEQNTIKKAQKQK